MTPQDSDVKLGKDIQPSQRAVGATTRVILNELCSTQQHRHQAAARRYSKGKSQVTSAVCQQEVTLQKLIHSKTLDLELNTA